MEAKRTVFNRQKKVDEIGLRGTARFARTHLDEVAGYLKSQGKLKTFAQIRNAVQAELIRRHDLGRYRT